MGYGTRSNGFSEIGIKTFWPDNDDNTLYIVNYSEIDFDNLLEMIREHFGEDANFKDFSIYSERIHTDHITYDLYEPMDYTQFLIIRKKMDEDQE